MNPFTWCVKLVDLSLKTLQWILRIAALAFIVLILEWICILFGAR